MHPIFPLLRSYTRLTSNWLFPRLSVIAGSSSRAFSVSRILAPFRYFANIDYCLLLPLSFSFFLIQFIFSHFSSFFFLCHLCLLPFLSLPPAQTGRGNKSTRVRHLFPSVMRLSGRSRLCLFTYTS